MKTVWHIVRKDLRRSRWPVVFWLGYLLIMTIWAAQALEFARWEPANDVWDLRAGVIGQAMVLQLLLLYALSVGVVQSDPTGGTRAFWLTRPISRTRLLAAKLGAVSLIGLAFPVAALVPVWIACGFLARDIWQAALGMFVLHGIVLFGAVVIGALTQNVRQAVGVSVGLFAVFILRLVTLSRARSGPTVVEPQGAVLSVFAIGLAVLAVQYFSRRTKLGWAILGVGTLTSFLLAGSTRPGAVEAPRASDAIVAEAARTIVSSGSLFEPRRIGGFEVQTIAAVPIRLGEVDQRDGVMSRIADLSFDVMARAQGHSRMVVTLEQRSPGGRFGAGGSPVEVFHAIVIPGSTETIVAPTRQVESWAINGIVLRGSQLTYELDEGKATAGENGEHTLLQLRFEPRGTMMNEAERRARP